MKKVIALFCMYLICPALIFAQTGKLTGIISDKNGKPVNCATILIQQTSSGTETDIQGTYLIENLPAGIYSVWVSVLGYNQGFAQITIKPNETQILNFTLNPRSR